MLLCNEAKYILQLQLQALLSLKFIICMLPEESSGMTWTNKWLQETHKNKKLIAKLV